MISAHYHHHSLSLLLLLITLATIQSISIDNDIIGEPDIECLDQEIRVWVKTRKFFQGRIYAKGKADDPECAKEDFSTRRTKKVHFDLGLGRCGMRSLRSFDPRGMYYGVTLVISFHPLFITKVDQAFHVKCFFEEAQRGLTAELGVSMIPTTEVQARHGIPGCSYSIHRSSIDELDAGRPAGSAIQFARVGDKVLHQWHCDDQMFGILINNCFVTDGVKQKHRVIDDKGCPVDPIAITGIRYSADLQRAYAESQVFKFADRPGVWFFCQIQMCMKKDGMCDGVTPPGCASTSPPVRKGSRPKLGHRKAGDDAEEGQAADAEASEGGGANASNEQQDTEGGGRQYEAEETEEYEAATSTAKAPEFTTSGRAPTPPPAPPRQQQRQRESPSAGGGYGAPPSPITDSEDVVFGPGYTANQVGPYGPTGVGRDPPGATPPPNPYFAPSPAPSQVRQRQPQQQQQEEVGTEFETEDDLRRGEPEAPADRLPIRPISAITTTSGSPPASAAAKTTTPGPASGRASGGASAKKDYVDYDSDVTIPPNLTDLLANLQPEDISAQRLQRMFRDSVADRRALLNGFDALIRKMKREEAEGDRASARKRHPSGREEAEDHQDEDDGGDQDAELPDKQRMVRRDSPITDAQPPPPSEGGHWHAFRPPDGTPTIAGQLLIYDLDESPPPPEGPSAALPEECALTRRGLTLVSIGSACLAAALLLMAVAILARLRWTEREAETDERSRTDASSSVSASSRDSVTSMGDGEADDSILRGKRKMRRRTTVPEVDAETEVVEQRKSNSWMG